MAHRLVNVSVRRMSFPASRSLVRPLAGATLLGALAWGGLHFAPHALARLPALPTGLDPGVVLLLAPVVALLLAMLMLALKLAVRGGSPDRSPPDARPIPHWQDEEG